MNGEKRRKGCLWPMWSHGVRPTHEYCGDKRSHDSSYCEKHRKMSIRDYETEPRQQFVPYKYAA